MWCPKKINFYLFVTIKLEYERFKLSCDSSLWRAVADELLRCEEVSNKKYFHHNFFAAALGGIFFLPIFSTFWEEKFLKNKLSSFSQRTHWSWNDFLSNLLQFSLFSRFFYYLKTPSLVKLFCPFFWQAFEFLIILEKLLFWVLFVGSKLVYLHERKKESMNKTIDLVLWSKKHSEFRSCNFYNKEAKHRVLLGFFPIR